MKPIEKCVHAEGPHSHAARGARSSDGRLEVRLSRAGSPGAAPTGAAHRAGWSAGLRVGDGVRARNMREITLPADHRGSTRDLNPGPKGRLQLAARLYVSLPGIGARGRRKRLVEAAHQVCPYSRATHGTSPSKTTLV